MYLVKQNELTKANSNSIWFTMSFKQMQVRSECPPQIYFSKLKYVFPCTYRTLGRGLLSSGNHPLPLAWSPLSSSIWAERSSHQRGPSTHEHDPFRSGSSTAKLLTISTNVPDTITSDRESLLASTDRRIRSHLVGRGRARWNLPRDLF